MDNGASGIRWGLYQEFEISKNVERLLPMRRYWSSAVTANDGSQVTLVVGMLAALRALTPPSI